MKTKIQLSKTAIKAIKASIHKWEKIAENKGEDRGLHNCSLCVKYEGALCSSCPVYKAVGATYCKCTPYSLWISHHSVTHDKCTHPLKVECYTCKAIALAEVTFLSGLLTLGQTK